MNFRQNLSDTIALLDQYPQIKTDGFSKAVATALKNFRAKFDAAIEVLDEARSWEELKSRLVKMPQADAERTINTLPSKDYAALCKLLKINARATKKLTSREAGQIKLIKKIEDIRKQTY